MTLATKRIAWQRVTLLCCAVLMTACTSISILPEEKDRGPDRPVSVSHIGEPTPKVEPRTRAGNSSPYTVLGKTYRVLPTPENYRVKGVASWYGKKFHGRRTANGEIYDMYAMTAAHKTLPIPSYVRVTNLSNKRSVIVRVNDRGPFHGGRIIDLSYTAAKKLGFENLGTAHVEVEYIDPHKYSKAETEVNPPAPLDKGEPRAPAPDRAGGYKLPANTWLQAGAFSLQSSAVRAKQKIEALTTYPVVIVEPDSSKNTLYRVRIGPIKDNFDLLELRKRMKAKKLPEPHVVYN